MIVNASSQAFSASKMRLGDHVVGSPNSVGRSLSIKALDSPKIEAAAPKKNSIYGNFEKEMSRRLAESAKKSPETEDAAVGREALVQSLTGAMGEIEQVFGREAATEVMARIITGTAEGVTEESLLSSIQDGLAGLKHLDLNETKIKELATGFNKDLALDPESAAKKLKNKETVSLSYALAGHFGSLSSPGQSEEDYGESPDPAQPAKNAAEVFGFSEAGRWDKVTVEKLDAAAMAELKEMAEAGLDEVTDLAMADIMEKEAGDKLFQDLADFLVNTLHDEESAAFVEKCLAEARSFMSNQYGASPKMATMLNQVYSKVAAEGDADRLALLENYINTDFKDALNPILSEMWQGSAVSELLGARQFKGVSGASLAGESDLFSLNWGYASDNAYDRSVSKRFLQEDVRGVKAVKEKQDKAAQDDLLKLLETTEAAQVSPQGKQPDGSDEAGEARDKAGKLREGFAAERRRHQLEEAMAMKFGQLDDRSREELEQYLKDHFAEEEAERLLEHAKWSNNVMVGLAGMHRDVRESGADEGKIGDFMNFLNGTMKKAVDKVANELGGVTFEGWQEMDGLAGELKAAFLFSGHQKAAEVAVAAPEREALGKHPAEQAAAAAEAGTRAAQTQKAKSYGCLVDLMA